MDKFTTLEGVAAPLKMINVDTDMIIPKQYLKTIKRTGLGKGLFAERRYRDDGSENPDFVLNKPAYRKAKILVAGDNFGCGSSREHAPWALMDFGITLRDLDLVRRHFLQQLLQERRAADQGLAGGSGEAVRRRRARRQCDADRSTSKSRKSAAPTAAWSNSTSTRTASNACSNGLDDIGLTMVKGQDRQLRGEEQVRAALGCERPQLSIGSRRLDVNDVIKPGSASRTNSPKCGQSLRNSGE